MISKIMLWTTFDDAYNSKIWLDLFLTLYTRYTVQTQFVDQITFYSSSANKDTNKKQSASNFKIGSSNQIELTYESV